jgi:DNA replication protein DnaC
LEAAQQAAIRFVADMEADAEPYWLTFAGTFGCGKTFLSRQIFGQAELINPGAYSKNPVWYGGQGVMTEENRRPKCVWMTEKSFASIVRGGDYDYPKYLRPDFLVVLDDLGSERDSTGFLANCLFDLANSRLGRWTIFSTNYSVAEIVDRLDGRIASRLIRDENRVVKITAGDYALRLKSA